MDMHAYTYFVDFMFIKTNFYSSPIIIYGDVFSTLTLT